MWIAYSVTLLHFKCCLDKFWSGQDVLYNSKTDLHASATWCKYGTKLCRYRRLYSLIICSVTTMF